MTRRLLAGVGALLLLATGLVGLPAFLLAAYQALDAQMPTLADLPGALLAPGDGGLFLLLMFGIGWVCWAVFTAAFAAELVARVRGVRPPHLGGFFPQVTVARAVAAIALMVTVAPTAGYAAPPATAAAATTSAAATRVVEASPANHAQPTSTTATDEQHEDTHDYVVKRGDTLWDIADEQLDDPTRYPEIVEASEDLPQSHGRHLTDPDLILPGWTLHIPTTADAAKTQAERQPEGAGIHPGADSALGPAAAHHKPGDEPATPVIPPTTPMRTTPPATADKPTAAAPGDDTPIALPPTPMRGGATAATPADPRAGGDAKELALPGTPMRHPGASGSAGKAAVYDAEGRAQPAHGVLGLPNWITTPMTPTQPEDAPELVAAAHQRLAAIATLADDQ